MKKLLREQMKRVIGGAFPPDDDGNKCKCANGTAALGAKCYFDPSSCADKCSCSATCKDQGSERGSICVAGTT